LAAPAPGDIADLTEPVSGASGKTALDLLRQLFADIEARTDSRRIGSATQMIDFGPSALLTTAGSAAATASTSSMRMRTRCNSRGSDGSSSSSR